VITPLSCDLPNRLAGGPKGSGADPLKIVPGTLLHKICGDEDHSEQYYCNYGVNQEYERQFVAAGLIVSARGTQEETRAVELPSHPFFIATLFQPQLSSRPENPHPVMVAFLLAALKASKELSEVQNGVIT
jgi:CTP synthase (UTP-ammonia lyase)